MKITFSLIVLLAVVAAGFAADSRLDDIWMEFKTKHQKDYTYSENELFRRAVWEKNYDLIIKHNREADQGMHTYWLGINEYTDMLSNEFVAMMNGFKGRNLTRHLPKFVYDEDTVDRLPKEVDWRNEGYVTDVKNQGDCGSCWAFSTTGSLEGQHFKKTKNLVSLSEQELVDCTSNCGNYGCDGGNVDNAFECIEEMGGIMSEDDYPYVGQRHGRSHRVFSTTGSPKGQHFKKPEKLDSLYKEESGHCTSDYGNTGGNGGYLSSAFWFVMTFGGLMSKRDNPSERQDDDCRFDKTKVAATITGFVDVKSGSEDALQNAVAIVGPISVAIDASDSTFQQYSHGIYKISTCSPTQLDHAVLAVGYGTEDSQDYWLVKNSWGKSWGLDGYIKMARNYGNMCGIATQASYPLV